MVSLVRKPFLTHYCGGVLIDPSHVLTAAQCVQPSSVSDIEVHIGGVELKSPEEV